MDVDGGFYLGMGLSLLTKKHRKPERLLQDTIEHFLSYCKDVVVMPIDNIARYNPNTRTFRPKKLNRGSVFYRGIPDLILVHKKVGFIGIEVKHGKGRQTPEQKEIEIALKNLGGTYIVVRSLQEVIDYLALWEKGAVSRATP